MTNKPEEGKKKSIFMLNKILKIDKGSARKPASITFSFGNCIGDEKADSDELIDDLITDSLRGFFSKVPVRGLTLSWTRYDVEK